jgi:peptidoglycan/LPS O-acetylase OafA/YrhL
LESRSNRISELDALRGFAALFVVLFHFTIESPYSRGACRFGVTGVDLFFMISGFVIFMTLNKCEHGKDFIISRITRLYPTYWTCVTFTFLLLFIQCILSGPKLGLLAYWLLKYGANMTMIQHYLSMPDIDGPYWTMIVELVFYIFMWALFKLKKLDKIQWIGALFLIAELVYHYVLKVKYPIVFLSISNAFPLINHFPLFFAGILFFMIWSSRQNQFTYILLVCCFFVQWALFTDGGRSRGVVTYPEYTWVLAVYFVLFSLFVLKHLNFLVNPVTLFLGAISYPLYLIHQTLSIRFLLPFFINHLHLNFIVAAVLVLGIIIPLAYGVVIFAESKYQRRLRDYLNTRF